MGITKKYWTGLDELHGTQAAQDALSNEFNNTQSVDQFLGNDELSKTNTGRRDFLKFMGFSVAAATLAACETPVVKSIPYVVKPEEITPGVANYYASTYYDGNDYGNILVKTREGRPIHIKGNKYTGISRGAVSSRINSSVLGLYDSARLRNAKKQGADISWADLDKEMMAALASANSIRVVSSTIASPSTQKAIAAFSGKFAGKVKHVQYDAISYNGLTKASEAAFGKAVVPQYDFSKAKTIVSVGADFLGTWLTSNLYSVQYSEGRRPENGWMSQHFQFESRMSLTGSNADVRVLVKPSEEGKVMAALYAAITGGSPISVGDADKAIGYAAEELKKNKGESLVVCGSNDPNAQMICHAINQTLGNVGHAVDVKNPISLFRGNDAEMKQLVAEMNAGSVDVLIVYGTNPAYSYAQADSFKQGLAKVKASVCFNLFADETASLCTYMAPDHHYLEAWNDFSLIEGRIDLAQPTISPLYSTRYAQESFLRWADNGTDYYTFVRQNYNAAYTPSAMNTDNSWHMAVHNGTFAGSAPAAAVVAAEGEAAPAPAAEVPVAPVAVAAAPTMNVSEAIAKVTSVKGGSWELSLYEKVTIGNGSHANNPLLQETPDPITKITWDNYVTMSHTDCDTLGLEKYIGQCDCANVVKVSINGGPSIELPVYPAAGQMPGTIGIALGYGRGGNNEEIGKSAYQTGKEGAHLMDGDKRMPIGKNAFGFVNANGETAQYAIYDVVVEKLDAEYKLASTQMHSTVMGRDSVVKETTWSTFQKEKDKKKGEAVYNMMPALVVHKDVNNDGDINALDKEHVRESDLWRAHPVEGVGHRWGMTIDLTACFGCGACITACHTENNVPVVGKDEVLRHRDMHWLRIDRYFSSEHETLEETKEQENLGTIGAYRHMEDPALNPKTVHMPMMCQHCNHAPCETVCPVAATVHSNEGLNNMAYNRCIGTRYCANNCPYKVRRFNWFNYVTNDKFAMVNPSQDETMRMVLNPDVTVRTRGVMEKCSMCQQRIQAGKLEAKKAGVPVPDGSIQTACSEACPTNAIVFGDLNDTKSLNTKRSTNNRSYHALEEVGIQPNIYYMTKVRNIEETEA
jgi:MoCo/4Fe-4S cofactor protein with predicted Tat translocation signal